MADAPTSAPSPTPAAASAAPSASTTSAGASGGNSSDSITTGIGGSAYDGAGGFNEPKDLGTREWSRKHFEALYSEASEQVTQNKGAGGKDQANGGAAAKPEAKSGKPAPADTVAETDDANSESNDEDDELDVSPEVVKKLRRLAREGKFDEIAKELKIDPNGMKIPSSRFAEFRQKERAFKRAQDQAKLDSMARDREFEARFADVQKTYGPLAEAKKLYDEGDVLGALEKAFGDFESISEAALRQKLASDPEVEKLKRREKQREQAEQARAEQARAEQAAAAEQAEVNRYLGQVKTELEGSDNAVIRLCAAEDPDFVNMVYRAQKHEYKTAGKLIDIHEAAEKVLDVVTKAHAKWDQRFGAARTAQSANSDQTATESENTNGRGTEPGSGRSVRNRTVRQRAPIEAPAPRSDSESLQHWSSQMKAALEKDRAARG